MGLMDKAGEFLNSDKGEEISDQALQTGADAANKATGDKFADQAGQAQQVADGKVGKQDPQQ